MSAQWRGVIICREELTSRVIVQVNSMSRVRLDDSLKHTSIREVALDHSRDAGRDTARVEAVATTVDGVSLTSNDLYGASEGIDHRRAIREREDLTQRHRLLGHLAEDAEADVEHAWVQEGEDVRGEVAPGEVAGWHVLRDRRHGRVPLVDQVAQLGRRDFLPDLVRAELDADGLQNALQELHWRGVEEKRRPPARATNGLVAEAERLVQPG